MPAHCWHDGYYRPLKARFEAFLRRNNGSPAAQHVVGSVETEIALYERFSKYFGYGVYIARRTDG